MSKTNYPTADYPTYVRERIKWYDGIANKHMRTYTALRVALVCLGATLPFVVAQNAPVWTWIAGIMGVAVALSTGLEGFFRPGEKWQNFRSAQVGLTHEEHKFLHAIMNIPDNQKKPSNADYKEAYEAFFTATQDIMRAETERFWKLAVNDQANNDTS